MIDYTLFLRNVIIDMTKVCTELRHIRTDALAISLAKARSKRNMGVLAHLTPLRFEKGATVMSKNGRLYQIPPLFLNGKEILYIVSFIYPRFLDLAMEEKAKTIIHELYHISTAFDGDIRRFPGRTFAHSTRRSDFDDQALSITKTWLQKTTINLETLSLNGVELKNHFGKVVGSRVSKPRVQVLP